jgi:hypothetical protein
MLRISDNDFDALRKLIDQFGTEAENCKKAGASLAGCIMIAGALEAGILAMAYCCEDEVSQTETFTRKSEPDLRIWGLKDLLDLAKELTWIPSTIDENTIARLSEIDPDEALRRGDVWYYADFVRETRDLVHAGRNLRLWSGIGPTKEYLDTVEETVQVVFDILYQKLIDLIKDDI